ncbi:MAG: hypothetical protein PUP92_18980 [Rhizonema sp. PD38]|nr:hypothetical protein [Rhizonema sp. PD38]
MFTLFNKSSSTALALCMASLSAGYVLNQISVSASTGNAVSVLMAAKPQTQTTHRVNFPAGKSSTVIKGSVQLGKKETYIFHARKGQTIIALVTWNGSRVDGKNNEQGLSGYIFVKPDGQSYSDPQNDQFSATLTGDYKVIIAQPYKLSSPKYTFELSIR